MVPVWKLSLLSITLGHHRCYRGDRILNIEGELTMLKHVNSRDEFYELIKEGTVLVDFFATWCGPCKMLSPVLEQLSEEVDTLILKVDVDEVGAVAAQFGIQAVPTLMLFKNGQRVDVRMGYQNKNQLLAFINQ